MACPCRPSGNHHSYRAGRILCYARLRALWGIYHGGAEGDRILRGLEKEANDKVDLAYYEASEFISRYEALINGFPSILTVTASLAPLFLAMVKALSMHVAYYASLTITLSPLFPLGYYLGRIAKGNGWLYGVKTLAVGAVAAPLVLPIELTLQMY